MVNEERRCSRSPPSISWQISSSITSGQRRLIPRDQSLPAILPGADKSPPSLRLPSGDRPSACRFFLPADGPFISGPCCCAAPALVGCFGWPRASAPTTAGNLPPCNTTVARVKPSAGKVSNAAHDERHAQGSPPSTLGRAGHEPSPPLPGLVTGSERRRLCRALTCLADKGARVCAPPR